MTISIAGSSSTITFDNSTTETTAAGKIIYFQRIIWDKRTVVIANTKEQDTIWQPMVRKTQANSNLLVKVNLSMRTNYSDCLDWRLQYGSNPTLYQGTMPYDAGFAANARPYHSVFYITGDTQVGVMQMNLMWRTANITGCNAPADHINTGYRDDNRLDQEYSQMVVFEIAT